MENVEARLAALEQTVAELRNELARERTRIKTMRHTHQCPSCGGKHLVYFLRVNESANSADGVLPISLDTYHSAWSGGSQARNPLHLYACRTCGHVEWHAPFLEYVRADGKFIFDVGPDDPPPGEGGPFR